MRGRHSHSPFSLFSFQDIVTSVTAILILIMLLLTLEMITRRRQEAVTDPAVTQSHLRKVIASLEVIVERLRQDLAEARRSQIDQWTREKLETEATRSEAELATVTARLRETERTRGKVANLRKVAEESLAELDSQRSLLAALSAQCEADQNEADRLERVNRQERDRQDRQFSSGTQLVFNIPKDANRRSWLVELSRDGAVVFLVDGDKKEFLGTATRDDGDCGNWINRLNPEGDQCLLLLRPSVDLTFVNEFERALERRGIGYGRDIIGEKETIRIGSAVAAGRPD